MRFEKLPACFQHTFRGVAKLQNEVKLPTIYERQHTVDGRYPANQLRLVDPMIYRVLAPSQMVSRISSPSTLEIFLATQKNPSGFSPTTRVGWKLTATVGETYQGPTEVKRLSPSPKFPFPKKFPAMSHEKSKVLLWKKRGMNPRVSCLVTNQQQQQSCHRVCHFIS